MVQSDQPPAPLTPPPSQTPIGLPNHIVSLSVDQFLRLSWDKVPNQQEQPANKAVLSAPFTQVCLSLYICGLM